MASEGHLRMTPIFYKTSVHETMGFNVFNYSNILFVEDAGMFVMNSAPGKFTPIPDALIDGNLDKMYMRGDPIDPNRPPKLQHPLEMDVDGKIFFPVSFIISKNEDSTTSSTTKKERREAKKYAKKSAKKESKIKKEETA